MKILQWKCSLFLQPMILITGSSWQNVHSSSLGLLEGAGYSNCYTPSHNGDRDSPPHGNHNSLNMLPWFCTNTLQCPQIPLQLQASGFCSENDHLIKFCKVVSSYFISSISPSFVLELEFEGKMEEKNEEVSKSLTDTPPSPSGPSGLVIFGRLLQKHSYVSALVIMMVKLKLISVWFSVRLKQSTAERR